MSDAPIEQLPAWFDGLDPVVVGVGVDDGVDDGVDGRTHRIVWERGVLGLEDHGEPEAESALAALGGGRCVCLDVLDAWRAQAEELEILTVGRRHAGERVHADRVTIARLEWEATRWRNQWSAATDDLRAGGDGAGAARLQQVGERAERRVRVRQGFVRLLALDDRLQDRLQVTVLAAAERRWHDESFRRRHGPRLAAALAGRAGPALATARLGDGSRGAARERIWLLAPGEAPVVQPGEPIRLPLSWLTNVWARGVAVVEGRFVTHVTGVEEGGKVLVLRGVDGEDWRFRRA